jgi:hypothetical protein
MQLGTARICMDCEEIHDQPHCPVCGSEMFAYLSRWIPSPERRIPKSTPTPTDGERLQAYRELLGAATQPKAARWARRGALGLAAMLATGLLWRRSANRRTSPDSASESKPGAG